MSKEIILPGQVFVKIMKCDCGGEMRYEVSDFELMNLQLPLKYKHVCNKCGKEEYFAKVYPIQQFVYQFGEE